MTQTATQQNSTNMAQLLGLTTASTQNGQGLGKDKTASTKGGLSFQALLELDPAKLDSTNLLQNIQKMQQGIQAEGSASRPELQSLKGLPSLLQIQSDGESPPLTLAERLMQNIRSMLGQMPAGNDGSLHIDSQAGTAQTGLFNTPGSSSESTLFIDDGQDNLMFMFNAPGAIYGLSNGKGAIDAQKLSAIKDMPITAETAFALMMQQAGLSAKAGDVSLDNIADAKNTIMSDRSAEDLKSELAQLGQDLMSVLSQLQNTSKDMSAILAPFLNNLQAGQSHNALKNIGKNIEGFILQKASIGKGDGSIQSLSDLFVMGRGENGLKPFLKGHSALTPTQMNLAAGLGSMQNAASGTGNAAGTATNTAGQPQALSFANIFEMGGGMMPEDNPDMPELQHGLIKADIQAAASKANPLMAAKTAGTPHPATQNVMQQLNLMASRTPRGDTDMRMQLDPPELGKLLVNLKFGKDNTVKAHLTVERPETLLMLQKDAASLQKALEDAGLNVKQDSLSFNLQQQGDGNTANQDGQGGNNAGAGNNSDADKADQDQNIIETEMTIFVDPETGQQRVNMMV